MAMSEVRHILIYAADDYIPGYFWCLLLFIPSHTQPTSHHLPLVWASSKSCNNTCLLVLMSYSYGVLTFYRLQYKFITQNYYFSHSYSLYIGEILVTFVTKLQNMW